MHSFRLVVSAALLAVVSLAAIVPAHAQGIAVPTDSTPVTMQDFDRNVFFFGGRFHEDYFSQSFTPWSTTWENNYFVGAGFQQFFYRWGPVKFGAEVGVGDRFNADGNPGYPDINVSYPANSLELWAGGVIRYDGWDIGPVHVAPALTAGFSAVTGLIGTEALRDSTHPFDRFNTGGKFLYYLGPELSFSMPQYNQNLEVFTRIQHRSGGFSSLMDLDGSNADAVGVRWKF